MASGKYDYLHKKNGYGKVEEVEYGDTMETVSASSDAPSANSYKPRQTKIRTSALDAAHLRNDRSRLKSEIGKIQNTLVSGELYKNGANKAAADRDYHNKYNRMKSLEKELATIDTKLKSYEYDEYLDDTHENNFGGRFEANLAQGRLSQDSSAAWNKYLSNPTDENRQLAEHIDYVAEQFGANNKKVLAEDGLISKSLANYLPQLKDQTKAQIIGGLGGAAAGAGVALGAGLLAPTPEEVVTVPTLAVKGLKTGITAASGLYSYGNIRGAAFRELISSGVDEETARAAASDEALISGLIEMADTGIDIKMLGIGKLIDNVGKFGLKTATKLLAKEGTEAATEKSIKKVVSALGKYGLNIAQEAAEEGSQEIVSIANQQRALEGNTGKADLLLNSIRKGFNLNAAEKAQVLESAAEGAKIASMLGGATMVGTGIANRAIDNRNNRMYSETGRTFSETETVDDVIQTGLESAPETESYRLAQEIQAKREAGIEPTDAEIGKLHIENIRTINEEEANSEINAEETSEISVSEPLSHNDIREPLYNNGVNNVELTNADRLLNELAIETQTAKLSEAENHFGENGKKAFRNYYQQENSVEDYYNGFSRFYEAGKVGLPFDKVNTVYSKGISPAVQYAAYAAGQNDEKVYLKRDKLASKVFYPKGNLVINEYSKKLSKAEADFYNRLSAITGNKIEFVRMDSIADGAADGSYSKGLINAEIGTEETRYVVISHEITHGLQRTSPQEYRAYRNYAVQLAEKSNGGDVSIVEQYSRLYKTDTENAMDEVAADFTKRIFKDKTEMERFINDNIQDNRSMLEKFFDTVKAFVDKIKNAFKGDKKAMDKAAVDEFGTTISELEEARRLWLKALKATDEKVKATQTDTVSIVNTNNDIQFSLKNINGNQIVWVENSHLTNKELKNPHAIAKYIEAHIGEVYTIIESGQKVYIGKDLPKEYTRSKYTSYLRKTNDQMVKAKAKATGELGLLIETATNRRWEETRHTHNKDAKYGIYRYDSRFAFPVKDNNGKITNVRAYDVELIIRNASNRKKYLYDIVNIKENTANANILQQRVNRSAAHNAAKRSSVSEDNVAQYKTDVKFSLKKPVEDNNSNIDENKERTEKRFNAVGLQLPSVAKPFGSIGKVTYNDGNVNIEGVPFREYIQGNDIQFSLKNKNLDIDSRIPFTHLRNYINVSKGDSASLNKLEDAVKGIKRGTYVNKATEYMADINRETINKALHPKSGKMNNFSTRYIDNLNAMQVLPELFREAVYIDSKPPQKSKNKGKAIQNYHHFVAPLYMNNDEYRALITAREKTNSNTLYVLRVEVLPIKKRQSVGSSANAVSLLRGLPFDISVADLVNGVNIYDYSNQSAKSYGIQDVKFSLKKPVEESGNLNESKRFSFEDSDGNQLTKEQAEFFKDSKVRDENGNLKVMYHGTPNGTFTKFRTGTYFTDMQWYADVYKAQGASSISYKKTADNPSVYEVYLNIKKPFDTRNPKERRIFNDEFYRQWGTGTPLMESGLPDWVDGMDLQEFIEENEYDYDGLILDEGGIPDGNGGIKSRGLSYVVFSPEQVKNIDNLNPTDDPDIRFRLKKIDNGNEDTYNKYRWAIDNGLLSNAESAVFFENIGAIKRGEKFRKTYDGYYMIPTGENGINNTIVITDGDYIKPSIESVIKINIDNETELSNVREDIYESKAGMHSSTSEIVRGYEEEGISIEYKREDIWIYDGISSEVGRKNAENEGVYRNNSRQRNGRGSFGEDKNFSLKGDILKENAALKKYNEYLKAQMKLTKEYKVNSKQLDKLVKELIKENNSNIDKEELFNRLDEFYTYLQNSNELAWDDIKGKALDIAKDIIKESIIVNDEYYETYKDLKRFLKNTDITISEADRADFPDGYNNFRKANFGRLKLVNNGTNIDSIYQELDDMFPEYFDAEQYITAAEQAQNIVDVLDMLSEYEMQPDNYYVEQGAQFLADDIIERYFDIPQEKPTFADKKQNELIHQKIETGEKIRSMREQRDKDIKDNTLATQMHEGAKAAKTRRLKNEEIERIKQLSKERIKKLHKDKKTSIENLKNRQKEKETRMSDKRKRSILRNRIIRHINPMKTKLLKPSDNNHIPESMRTTVANILDAINLESKYSYDPLTGKRRNDNLGIPTKRTEEFLNLKEQYRDILKSDSANEIIIDPSLLGDSGAGIESIIDEVIKMRNIRLDDMTLEQLNTVWDVLRAVEASITNAGKMLSYQKYKTTSAFAEAFVSDTSSRKNKKSYTRKHYSLDLETPYTFFSHYGQAGKDFYRMLRNAQDYEQTIQSELTSKMENVVSSEQRKKLEKEIIEFTTENGDNLILSKAHIMNIYLLSKRKQAEGHLYGSGIRQPEINRKIRRGTKDIRITQEDLNKLFSNLTSEEKSIADNMQKLTLFLAEKGNKTTMSVYGYEKFTDPNYWTIKSAKEGLQQNVEEGQDLARSIRNMGAAKATVPKASNALEIGSVFEVFDNHASEMITYAAWLAPMEDANRLFNFSFRDEDGNKTGTTMKDLLNRIGGEQSTNYWMNLMKDIQNGISMPADEAMSGIVNKAIGNVKKAAVASNIRVVVQQPTAYLRAAVVLSPENMIEGLVKGATKGNGWKKAVKYAPIAAIKKVGGFEVSSNPKQLSEILYSPETKKGKAISFAKEFPTFGAGAADAITWGAIWNACELQVEKTKTNLTVGSESFYKATAELFTEVIDQTQVVDGILQRSQAMRSSNMLIKQATSFMGEPTSSLNLLMRAYDAWRYETIPKKRSAALKNMSRAAFALILSNVAVAIAQSAIDALRDDDEEKDYLERFLTALTGLTGDEKTKFELAKNIALGSNIGDSMNILTWIPLVKDMFSICQGYTIERMDAKTFGDFISAAQNAIKSFSGEGTWTMGYAATKTVLTGAKLFGSSASNLMRDIESILRSVLIETENWKELYNMEKGMYNLSTQTSRFFDILYQALESGDSSSYDYIAEDLIENGIKPKSIESSMRAHRKNAENPKYKKEDMGAGIKLKFEEDEKKKEEKFEVDNLSSSQYIEYMHIREKILDDIISDYEAKGLGKMDAKTANSLLDAAYEYANKVSLEEASDGKYEIDEKWIRDISNKSGSYSSVASQIIRRKKKNK